MPVFDAVPLWQIGVGLVATVLAMCFIVPWAYCNLKAIWLLSKTPQDFLTVTALSILTSSFVAYVAIVLFCIYSGLGGWWQAAILTVVFAVGWPLTVWLSKRLRNRSDRQVAATETVYSYDSDQD